MTLSTADTTIVTSSWSDVATLEGREFTGGWFSVDADRLEPFDFATYTDQNTFALEGSNFPDGLVEGFHLLALLDHLSNQVLYIETSIRPGLTINEYRRTRPSKPSRWERLKQLGGGVQAATA